MENVIRPHLFFWTTFDRPGFVCLIHTLHNEYKISVLFLNRGENIAETQPIF